MRLVVRIGVGLVGLLCVTVITMSTFKVRSGAGLKQGTDIQLPVQVKQLPAEGAFVPVELLCGMASATTPNRLNGFSCDLKNHTGKNIVAANIVYSIVLEEGGQEVKDTRFHTIVTTIDPDFLEKTKSITPGGTSVIRPAGSFTYDNSIVKGVEAYIDYIEFEDDTSLGPNENGSQFIKDFREGASKYKKWLAGKYKKDSIDEAIQLLGNDQSLPETMFDNTHQEFGAKYYRRRLRKMYKTGGRAEVQKHLSK